jgi:hypothetical protein
MDTVTSESANEKFAKVFERMAADLRHNGDRPFAGAVVIVAPGSNAIISYVTYGEVMEGNFWGGLGNELAAKVRDIEAKQRPYLR